jgi:hypothetical protein
MGTCCARPPDPNISRMTSTAGGLAMCLAFLYPAAQLLRLLDGLAAAIDPRLSVVGSLHDLLAAHPGSLVATITAVAVAVWLLRRARSESGVTVATLGG